jgi:hypothetical protein
MAETDALFSTGFAEDDPAKWGAEIADAFRQLEVNLGAEVRCVRWDKYRVAAAFTIKVNLPSRGPVGGVDIRPREPVMLVFNRRDYPEKAPMVRSDRKDFPVSRLSHLYVVEEDQPPALCLHRGNFDDWFAEHTLGDLLGRVRGWFRDAAGDRLNRDADFFEPTRLDELGGTAVFAPRNFQKWVQHGLSGTTGKPGFGFLTMRMVDPDRQKPLKDAYVPVRVREFYTRGRDLSEKLKDITDFNKLAAGHDNVAPGCFGILCWSARQPPVADYFGRLPKDVSGLLELCERYGIPLGEALREYAARGLNLLGLIPVVIAFTRPRPLIGTDSNVEPLCFVLDGRDPTSALTREPPSEAATVPLAQRSPLDPKRAREIAGLEEGYAPGRVLLFGCGALGSKLALHFGRSGHTALTLVDHDTLSPHNFVRHALLADRIGQNKAEAAAKSVRTLYESIPDSQTVVGDPGSALEWLKGRYRPGLQKHRLLVDATASGMVFEALVRNTLPVGLRVARCGISDAGRIGLLSFEGANRNPRIDDLNVLVYDMAVDRQELREWLERERAEREQGVGAVLEEISIGMSCSSDTTRMPDDLVSWHAASFSVALRDLGRTKRGPNAGWLVLNYRREGGGTFALTGLTSELISVDPVVVVRARGVRGGELRGAGAWQVRIRAHLVREMRARLHRAVPAETGGGMVGVIHPKRRVIYVTRMIDAPPDSRGTPDSFTLGTEGLTGAVDAVRKASGDLLGYVGDWHTHPRCAGRVSGKDVETMFDTKRKLDTADLPTFILIVTPKGVNAYVYESG